MPRRIGASEEEKQQAQEQERRHRQVIEPQKKIQSEEVSFTFPRVELPEVPSAFQSLQSIVEIWKWESTSPVSPNLFHFYEQQRDLFLLTQGLAKSMWIDHSQFLQTWQASVQLGLENLFAEILARKHVQLL